MKLLKKYLFMIVVLSVAAFAGCGGDVAGIEAGDVDDNLSSNYFIKSLVLASDDLYDETDPNATIINLKWEFKPGVWKNEATVPNKVTNITITAMPNMYATMFYSKSGGEDKELEGGKKSDPIALDEGVNTINIRVVAQDLGELVYEFKITRNTAAFEVATLKSLSITDSAGDPIPLSPEFTADSGGATYSATTQGEAIHVAGVPTSSDSKVEMILNDYDDPEYGKLHEGVNTLVVTCTSGDKARTETYTVNINRQKAGGTSTLLTALTIDGVDLAPVFSSANTSYEATATSSSITVSAQTEDADASYSVNSEPAGPATIALSEGPNMIAVTVTNKNGGTPTTYNISVSYSATQLSGNNRLKTLKVTADGEAKAIHPGTFEGKGQSTHDVASVKFTSTAYDYVTVIAGNTTIVVTAVVDDIKAKSVVFSGIKYYKATSQTPASGGITSQSFSGGVATATVTLDKGYVTDIVITVTAEDNTTQPYHLYAKLLNSDEYHWGIYAPAWDKSKSAWSTPSGISDKTYNGMASGTSRWRTGLSNNTYEGVSYGAKSEIILSNFNDGQNGILYDEGGHIINGTQFTYLKGANAKNGYNATPVGTEYIVTTAGGKTITSYNYHVKVTSSETVMHAEGTTDPTQQSYTRVTYLGETHIQYYRTGTAKPVPFGSNYNWFEPWSDQQWPDGHTNVDDNTNAGNN